MSRMKGLRGVIESKAHLAPAMTSKTQTHRTILRARVLQFPFWGLALHESRTSKGEGCLHWGPCCWGPCWGPAKQPRYVTQGLVQIPTVMMVTTMKTTVATIMVMDIHYELF